MECRFHFYFRGIGGKPKFIPKNKIHNAHAFNGLAEIFFVKLKLGLLHALIVKKSLLPKFLVSLEDLVLIFIKGGYLLHSLSSKVMAASLRRVY